MMMIMMVMMLMIEDDKGLPRQTCRQKVNLIHALWDTSFGGTFTPKGKTSGTYPSSKG